MNTKQVIIAIIVLLALILLLQNTQVVTINLFFWQISMSRIILIPLIFVLGFIVGFMVDYHRQKKKSEAIKNR